MSPHLALFLCFILIAGLFYFEFKFAPKFSFAIWPPLLWLFIISSKPFSQWLYPYIADTGTVDAIETGNPIDSKILLALILFGAIVIFRRRDKLYEIFSRNRWIGILFLFSLVSIVWSDFPLVAFKRYLKAVGVGLMVLIILTEKQPLEAMRATVRRLTYIHIPLSIILIKYFGEIGRSYGVFEGEVSYQGVACNKNALGRLLIICGFFLFWELYELLTKRGIKIPFHKRKVGMYSGLIAMIVWLLIKAQSSTAIAVLVIGIAVFLITGLPVLRKNVNSMGAFFFVGLLSLIILQSIFNITEVFVHFLGRNMTLTDRTLIWSDVLAMRTNPIFGVGYESFWLGNRLAFMWSKWWWGPTETHNGFLETYLNLGLIGLILWLIVLFKFYRISLSDLSINFNLGRAKLSFLFMIIFYNISEAAFNFHSFFFFIFAMLAFVPPVYLNQELVKEELNKI